MKQIIKNYGGFLLDVTVLALLITLLFSQITDAKGNRGILNMIGAGIKTEGADYAEYTDMDTYVTESSKTAPVISFDDSIIKVGNIDLTNHIKAADHTGAELQIKVLAVTNRNGTELSFNDASVNFPVAGIYEVKVTAVDAWNRRTTSRIRLAVNK